MKMNKFKHFKRTFDCRLKSLNETILSVDNLRCIEEETFTFFLLTETDLDELLPIMHLSLVH